MKNNLVLFKTVMAYFRPIGNVGFNVDMFKNKIEHFDGLAYTENGKTIKILDSINKYIKELLINNSDELYQSTNKLDEYIVDVTINPKENKIFFKLKYFEKIVDNNVFEFNWKKDIPTSPIELLYNVFESDLTIDEIIIDFNSQFGHTQIDEITLDKGKHETTFFKFNNDSSYRKRFKNFVRQIITKLLSDNYAWEENEGSEGVLIFNRSGDGYLDIDLYDTILTLGQKHIIDEDYFNPTNLNENEDQTKEDNNEIFKGYINIKKFVDTKPENLNLNALQSDRRFGKLLNTLLYEIYSDNLGMNEDNSNYGIINIYPLNEFTSWSILNYFGGHKFVKRILLDQFNKTKNEKTPKEFYRWLIENKETLLKTGPIIMELVKTNFNSYNKGTITEKYVINKLKSLNYDIKYFPPGSSKDKNEGIDIEVNGVSYQIKELINVEEIDNKIHIKTQMPKNYLGYEVKKIMLVNIKTGDFISFPNKDYELNLVKNEYVIDITHKKTIKTGNFNKI